MHPLPARIRFSASPLVVAVAHGLLGVHALLDDDEETQDEPSQSGPPAGAPRSPEASA